MARLNDMTEALADRIVNREFPSFDTSPWVTGPPLAQRRVAILTTSALQRRSDSLLSDDDSDYRIIPSDVAAADLIMAHNSTNFDRTGFQQDLNVVFPIDRLKELDAEGVIGSVAGFHYSVLGSTAGEKMKAAAAHMADLLKKDGVDTVLLVPV